MGGAFNMFWVLAALLLLASGVRGLRGLREILHSYLHAELDRLAHPAHWTAVRLLAATLAALPVLVCARYHEAFLWWAVLVGLLAFWQAQPWLLALRRRAERRILDDLPLHLDLIALSLESGGSWTSALAACVERVADSPLRRAWQRIALDIHAGAEPLDALRALEQKLRLPPFSTLVSALRAAEKLQMPAATVLRDRARQSAASRFARAERRARAAPIKLWAVLILCLAPCTAVVLAFPLAWWLSWWAG